MSRSDGLSQWTTTVSTQLPHLSRPQATVLALWSYGMVVAQSCGITTVAAFLGCLLHKKPDAVRQQLREWCYAAEDKTGGKRRDAGGAHLFWSLGALGAGLVGAHGAPVGAGDGRHDLGAALHGAGHQRR